MEGGGDGAGRGEKAEKGVGCVECGAGKFGCVRVKGVR